MRRQQLAQRLAVGLSRGRWSVPVLTAELERRLPQKVRALAHPLAVELVLRHPKPCAPTVRQVQQMLLQDASFDRVFQYCQKYGVWPDVGLSSPGMAPTDPFASLDLPVLSTPGALADWLFLPMERLDYLADPPEGDVLDAVAPKPTQATPLDEAVPEGLIPLTASEPLRASVRGG